MNLQYLFEIQDGLDRHIEDEHPRQGGEDRLSDKILALQVELGELANEWRGFKFWSNDQEPRGFMPNPDDICRNCKGEAYFNKEKAIKEWIICNECDGCGVYFHNPLLEEYVDGLHFNLSLGLEIEFDVEDWELKGEKYNTITEQFLELHTKIVEFYENPHEMNFVDMFECFIGLGEMLGFTWEQIEQAYLEKNKVNHERQVNGY